MHEKIVELLSQTEDYISGQELSTQLGVSRQAVWKAINTLKSQGYVFDSITRKGYKLVAYPEHLNKYAVKSHLNTNLIGKNLIVLDSVTSTNDYLKTLGAEGCEYGRQRKMTELHFLFCFAPTLRPMKLQASHRLRVLRCARQ